VIPGLAHGYDPGPGYSRLRPSPYREWSNTQGAGGLYSTVDDLVRWGQVILDRTFLSAESWKLMLADHGDGRGYGVSRYRRHDHLAIGHDGVTNGYTAFVEVYPEDETVVAYAGNIRSGAFEIVESAVTALALGLPVASEPVPSDTDRAIPPTVAERLVGSYELFPGFFLTITYQGGRLLLAGTGGYPTVLSSVAGGDFFYRAMYATIRFDPDAEDAQLVWIDRAGREYPARKTSP
jgi:CubicO group peptidase (beta-lactamase class C family)